MTGLLGEQVQVSVGDAAVDATLVASVLPAEATALGTEGFRISRADGVVRVDAATSSALLYGVFRLLATTSSSYIRFAGDCVLVWAAYALPTFLAQWPGSMFCYRGLGRGDVWAAGCVTWFYVLVAVNVKLFSARPRTRLGRRPAMRPPTRAVSSIRSPRRGGEPELTFFPAAASMPATP